MEILVPHSGAEDFAFLMNLSGENKRTTLSVYAACPARRACPVKFMIMMSVAYFTGVAPADGTGACPACPVKCATYLTGVKFLPRLPS